MLYYSQMKLFTPENPNKMAEKRKRFFPALKGGILRIFFLMLSDTCCAVGSILAVAILCALPGNSSGMCVNLRGILPFCAALLICNTLFSCYNGSILYPGAGVNKIEEIRRLAGAVCITYVLLFSWFSFFRNSHTLPPLFMLLSIFLTGIMLPIMRGITRQFLKFINTGQTDILIAGAGKGGAQVALEFQQDSYFGFRVVGFLDDDPEKQGQLISGIPVLGTLADAEKVAAAHNINYIVCCIPVTILSRIYRHFSRYFTHIMFVPGPQIFPIAWLTPVSIGIFCGFEIKNKLLQPLSRILKAVMELLLATIAIFCLLPLFLILIPVIKFTSPGPVFYRSFRRGQNDREIAVWKFRTMYADADSRLESLLKSDPALREEWERDFKLQNDPRITPVGNFLRKTSLDELPQFWNVLNGTMSIIGPRPIVKEEIKYYGKHYDLRRRVKPGITGLWQVSGRSDTDYRFRVLLDTYYIMNWSIWMDYYIFFKTVYIVLMRKGAR